MTAAPRGFARDIRPLFRPTDVDAMAFDKKVKSGRLRFVLPSRLGAVEVVGDVAEADVRASLSG